jgi:hypothetical protein
MGLLDMAATVVTRYKIDTKDAKAELRSLSAEQKRVAKEQIEAVEAQNKKLDGYVGTLGKVGIALGAVAGAVLVGKAGFEAYTKATQLAANTAGVDIDRLGKAADGLKSRMDLLTFANNAQRGTWKLNQAQMETVLKGMRALELKGYDATAMTEKFSMALAKGNAEELKEYGINVKNVTSLLIDMEEISRKSTGSANTQADSIRRAGVEFENAKDTITQSIGQMVVSMAPLIAQVAKLATEVAKLVGPLMKWFGDAADAVGVDQNDAEAYIARMEGRASKAPTWDKFIAAATEDMVVRAELAKTIGYVNDRGELVGGAFGALRGDISGGFISRGNFALNQATRALPTRRGGAGARVTLDNQFGSNVFDERLLFGTPESVGADLSTAFADLLPKGADQRLIGLSRADARYGAFSRARSQSKLAEMFGPIEEFKAYAAGFDLLTTAATSAFNAWITGSASLGDAIKKGIADGLVGTAGQMLSQSLLHGAYAVGSLAFGDVRGAAQHGKAAALFAAGAVATGTIAKALGGGAAPGGGAGAPAPNVTGGASSSSAAPRQTIVVLGDSYDDMTPRQRKERATRSIQAALRESSAGDSAVRFE